MQPLTFIATKYFNHKANSLQMGVEEFYKSQQQLWKKMRRQLKGTQIYRDLQLEFLEDYDSYVNHLDVMEWDFYAPYVEELIAGKKRVLFNDEIEYFGLTSGTSGKDSKRIPYNRRMIKTFLNAQKAMASIISSQLDINMLTASRLTFGSAPTSYSDGKYKYGYISGILSTKTPIYLQKNTFPSAKTLHIENWDEKVDAIIEETIGQDIEVISGIPTYIITIFETVLEKTGKKNLREIWPNLKVFIYGATPITQYQARLDELVGHPLEYFGIYAATEAPIGLAYTESTYILNPDLLYSFTPVDNPDRQVGVNNLEVGQQYYINIGTANGFLNYSMKDVIEIKSLDRVIEYIICGRKNTGMNLAAEKVSDQQLFEAISKTRVGTDIDIRHFFVSPQMKNGRPSYLWTLFVEDAEQLDENRVARYLDERLREVCGDYDDCRIEGVIEECDVTFKSLEILERYFLQNQHRGQFKMKTSFPTQSMFEKFLLELEGVRV